MPIPEHLQHNYWDKLLAQRAGVRQATVLWRNEGEPLYTHDPTDVDRAVPCPVLIWETSNGILYRTAIAPCKQNEKFEWNYVQVNGKPIFYGEEPTSEEFVDICAKFIKLQMEKQQNN